MMRQYELLERVTGYNPHADEALLNRAYVYAMKAHGNQRRASGDPYFSHPLEVAAILADMKLDDATIAAALLHDTIEDTGTTRDEIDQVFGEEIGALVEGLTKIKKLDLVTKKAEQAENFRKLLVAISSDIRVLLVKLVDRLHNMRTLGAMKPGHRRRIAEETMDIYAPLAGRMGMQSLRDELEDLAFRWLNPEAYEIVSARLNALHETNAGLIAEIAEALQAKLADNGIAARVSSREKKPYSIWRKMERKQISLEQLSDIFGFRVITPEAGDCYRTLGVIHTSWPTVPGRFKDYISTPKQNDYQSIHTTIVGPRHQRVELQIRTGRMHDVAEYGVAAHAFYKDALNGQATGANGQGANGQGANGQSANGQSANGQGANAIGPVVLLPQQSNAYQWLRRLVDMLLEGDNPEEFLEHTKLELFQDQVFCFTPKGRLIALPRNATPIDFAYAVHTDIGNSCVGCKINGRHVPLASELSNGDEVEIVRSKAQVPPPAWEGIAITGKARSAIRRATREAVRRQYGELGRVILERAFERAGKPYDTESLSKGLHRLSQKSVEDVLAAVGRGELASADVIQAALPDAARADMPRRQRIKRTDEGWFGLTKAMGLKFRMPGASSKAKSAEADARVPIRGLNSDLPVTFPSEGGAIPGDRIVGILSPGEGIAIYPIHSMALQAYEDMPERWIDVTWDIDERSQERFPARICVTAINEPGSLAQIAQVIGEAGGNIDELKMTRRAHDFTEIQIDLEVWDLRHLNGILAGLRARSAVSKADRVHA